MIYRTISSQIQAQLKKFPVVAVTGPRQSGKTTLVRHLLSDYAYYNLEDLNTKKLVHTDPVGFINQIGERAVIDEIQKAPELLSQIQVKVDQDQRMGQFVITGSESLVLSEKIAQSLAGRVARNTLLPLSLDELKASGMSFAHPDLDNIDEMMLHGFYPRIYDTAMTYQDFYPNYISSYVERDVRQLQNVGDLSLFEKFLQLLAGRVGQILNSSSLANDVGVSHNTIERWISLLEASYVVYRLKPFYRNLGKRVIKSPKIYFYDVGLVCNLLQIHTPKELIRHYAYGSLFENFVISEVYKYIYNHNKSFRPYFYRDSNQVEVDLLLDTGGKLLLMEIKSSETFTPEFLKNLRSISKVENIDQSGYVVYKGPVEQSVGEYGIVGWQSVPSLLATIDEEGN